MSVDYFSEHRCTDDVVDVGIFMMALIYDITTIAMNCRSRPRFGDRHDVIEWSVDTQYNLAIIAAYKINN